MSEYYGSEEENPKSVNPKLKKGNILYKGFFT